MLWGLPGPPVMQLLKLPSMAGCLNSLSCVRVCVGGGGDELSCGETVRRAPAVERVQRASPPLCWWSFSWCWLPAAFRVMVILRHLFIHLGLSRWCVYAPSCCLSQPRRGHKMWARITRPGLIPSSRGGGGASREIRIPTIWHSGSEKV